MFKKGDHLKKSKSAMAGVYAGPDSLYWKTGKSDDINKIDPDSEAARKNVGADDTAMEDVYAGPQPIQQPILPQPNTPMMCVYAGPDSMYWRTRRMEDVNMLDPDAAKMREAFNKTKETQNNGASSFASDENAPDMQKSEKKRFCPVCGSLVSLSDHFCRECGAKLTYPDTDKQV